MSRFSYIRVSFPLALILFLGVTASGNAPPAEKPQTWVEVRTAHFVVASNDGEKTARRVGEQFEQIRYLYANTLQKEMRLDPSIPILILAVKDEKELSRLIPEYWAKKGNLHPAGLFVAGPEKNYIALRTNVEGELPYSVIYHEYVHLIVSLNFRHFPAWLNEGYANFLGFATITSTGGIVGHPSSWDLYLLNQNKLLPLDVLFKVDHSSPHYNEANKATIFYAESWALVHYLMLIPEKQKLLGNYIQRIETGEDPLAAARAAFGDLAKLQKDLEAYTRNTQYFEVNVRIPSSLDSKEAAVRTISPAEAGARLGDFDLYRGQLDFARPKLEEAIRLDPKLPAAQESMGYLLLRQEKRDEADKYFAAAIEADSTNPLAYYYHAMMVMLRQPSPDEVLDARAALEKSVSLNPGFAPAWFSLGSLYLRDPDTLEKALAASQKASDLFPGEVHYQFNVAIVLVRLARYDEARKIAQQLQASGDPLIASESGRLLTQLDQLIQRSLSAGGTVEVRSTAPAESPVIRRRTVTDTPADTATGTKSPVAPPAASGFRAYSMVGTIGDASCSSAPEVLITLTSRSIVMKLHAVDIGHLEVKSAGAAAPLKDPSCAALRGRTARVSYQLSAEKSWDGEIQSIELR